MAMNVKPPRIVLWKFDFTESKKNLPKIFAIVGIRRAPQRTRVADTGLERGGRSFSLGDSVVFVDTSILKKKY